MKPYLITTGSLFGLLVAAHLLRTIAGQVAARRSELSWSRTAPAARSGYSRSRALSTGRT